MSKVLSIFMLLLCINIMIVVNGYTISDSVIPVLTGVTEVNAVAGLNADAQATYHEGLTSNVSGTLNTDGKNYFSDLQNFFDPVGIIIGFINVVGSVLFAPFVIGFALQFPGWLFLMVCLPLAAAFWVSAILLIRGVS